MQQEVIFPYQIIRSFIYYIIKINPSTLGEDPFDGWPRPSHHFSVSPIGCCVLSSSLLGQSEQYGTWNSRRQGHSLGTQQEQTAQAVKI